MFKKFSFWLDYGEPKWLVKIVWAIIYVLTIAFWIAVIPASLTLFVLIVHFCDYTIRIVGENAGFAAALFTAIGFFVVGVSLFFGIGCLIMHIKNKR